jgi:hypothetical protein
MTLEQFEPFFRLLFPDPDLRLIEYRSGVIDEETGDSLILIKTEDKDGMIEVHTIQSAYEGLAASDEQGDFETFELDDEDEDESDEGEE